MGRDLAVRAKRPDHSEFPSRPHQLPEFPERNLRSTTAKSVGDAKEAAAKLYGLGMKRMQIARALGPYLVVTKEPKTAEECIRIAYRRLKKWEQTQEFRDAVWKHAVVALDMSGPDILRGVARAAKRGRVDAARLALEVTGRHTAKGDQVVAQIQVNVNNIPRPE